MAYVTPPYENRLKFYILYNDYMPKRSRKQDEVINVLAKSIVGKATKEPSEEKPAKNPAAVELGRLGGLKGGKARAEKLSAKRRKEIAEKAAKARWKK
jgi:hypothetical protein